MTRLIATVLLLTFVACAPAQDEKKGPNSMLPCVKMTTNLGDFIIELNAEKAPITVENFLRYAQDGFYADTIFHRVIATFMVQGGGFTADLTEKKQGLRKPIKNEWRNGLKNDRGTIAMARTQAPDSATAQFYINVVDNKQLDMPRGGAAYCVFGKVVEGMEVVDKIKDAEVTENPKLPMGKVVPATPIVIKSVTLVDGWKYDEVFANIEKARSAAEKAEMDAKLKERDHELELSKEFQTLLEERKDAQGRKLQQTDSGLMYVVLKEGDGRLAQPADTVTVDYTGWTLDGKKFDSSVDRGTPATFSLGGVIRGWTEGVSLMKIGAKYRFILPPELGYGDRGNPPRIPPKATLVFDVELYEIK